MFSHTALHLRHSQETAASILYARNKTQCSGNVENTLNQSARDPLQLNSCPETSLYERPRCIHKVCQLLLECNIRNENNNDRSSKAPAVPYLIRSPVIKSYPCILPLFYCNQESYPGTDPVFPNHTNSADSDIPYS